MAPCSASSGSPAEGSSVHRLVDRRGRIDRLRRRNTSARCSFRKEACQAAGSSPRHWLASPRRGGRNAGHGTCPCGVPRRPCYRRLKAPSDILGDPDTRRRDRIVNRERATASQMSASTRLLHACQCAARRCCRVVAVRRPSKWRPGHRAGPHRPSGFPQSARSGGSKRAVYGAGSLRDVVAASGRPSLRREDRLAPIPNIRPGGAHPELQQEAPACARLQRPVFPSASSSACASLRVGRSFSN